MKITLDLDIKDSKVGFILELLNNFEFVSIESKEDTLNADWANELTDHERKMIEKGLADIEAGRVIPHEEVRAKIDKWIKEKQK